MLGPVNAAFVSPLQMVFHRPSLFPTIIGHRQSVPAKVSVFAKLVSQGPTASSVLAATFSLEHP